MYILWCSIIVIVAIIIAVILAKRTAWRSNPNRFWHIAGWILLILILVCVLVLVAPKMFKPTVYNIVENNHSVQIVNGTTYNSQNVSENNSLIAADADHIYFSNDSGQTWSENVSVSNISQNLSAGEVLQLSTGNMLDALGIRGVTAQTIFFIGFIVILFLIIGRHSRSKVLFFIMLLPIMFILGLSSTTIIVIGGAGLILLIFIDSMRFRV